MSFLAHCRIRFVPFLCALALLVSAQEEKRLTVYGAPSGVFLASIRERNNAEYVPLMDVLQRLGSVTAKTEGKKFNLRFGNSIVEFRAGKNKVKIGGKNIDLAGDAAIEQGALLIPVRGLAPVLNALLGERVEYRETGHRIILGDPIDFAAEMRTNPSRLLLHFSRPVNPTVASGPGHLRLNFVKDPVVAPESTQTFNDKLIPSAMYSENSGTAVLTVAGSAPLIATFSDEGKTITIAAVPQVAAEKPPAAAPPPVPVPPVALAPQAPQPAPTEAPARPKAVVVIDPAHGGDDRGAVLEPGSNEKDLTLIVARKLRAALDKLGVPAILLREGDVTLNADDRASAANTARTLIYVGVHAGNVGRGVRIYTARLSAPPAPAAGAMVPWGIAQAAYLDRSRELADNIAAQLARASVDHAQASAQVQPLPHLTSAAVVVELLPDKSGVPSLQSAEYQQRVCAAVAEGIAGERRTLEARK